VSLPSPQEYTENGSGTKVTVTMVTGNMSAIGPDFFALDELIPGDYIVDFPDGSSQVLSPSELSENFRLACE
jgi:hypothetical protein